MVGDTLIVDYWRKMMLLLKGNSYFIEGLGEGVYLGKETCLGVVQYKFRVSNGFGIWRVTQEDLGTDVRNS